MKVSVTFLVLAQLVYLLHASPLPVQEGPKKVEDFGAARLPCSFPLCNTFSGKPSLSSRENSGPVKVAPEELGPPESTPSGSENPLEQTLALMDELNVGHAVPLEALPLVKNIRTSNSNSNGSNNDNGKGIPYGQVVKETDDDTENAAGRNMAVPDQVSPTPEDGLVHHIISQTDLGELGEDDLKLLTEKGILVKEGNDVILNFRQVEKLGILKPGIIKEDGSLPLENWQQISLNGNEHKLDYLVEKSGNDYVYNLNHLAQLIRDIEGANSAESSTTDRASAPMVKSSTMSEMVKQEVHRSKPMLGAQEPNLPDTEASLGHWTEKVSEEHHRYPSTTARSSHSTKKAPLKPLSHDEQVNVLYGIFKKVLAWIKEAKYSGLFSTIS